MIALRQATGWSAGTLVANVGMTLHEVRERSSLELGGSFDGGDMQITADEMLFDLEVASTGVRIDRCGYYLLRTRGADWRVDEVTVFVTRRNLSRAAVDAAAAAVHQTLTADGWTRGRSKFRRQDDPFRYWLKDDILFITERFRTDRHDKQPDEDPRTAGKFFLIVRVATLDEVERRRLSFPGVGPTSDAG
jgi:hypothetical protein